MLSTKYNHGDVVYYRSKYSGDTTYGRVVDPSIERTDTYRFVTELRCVLDTSYPRVFAIWGVDQNGSDQRLVDGIGSCFGWMPEEEVYLFSSAKQLVTSHLPSWF